MEFRILNAAPLKDYREACRVTLGMQPDINNFPPLPFNEVEYWIKQIVANHSTLRSVRFRMIAEAPKSVIMQIIRATKGHPQPEVQSSRPDWVGKERSGDPYELKLFMQDHTAESFVEMAKQRLCMRTEDKTREFMQKAVEALKQSDEPFLVAVGYCCKPYCEWYCSCPEIKSCGKSPSLSAWIIGEYKKDKEKS